MIDEIVSNYSIHHQTAQIIKPKKTKAKAPATFDMLINEKIQVKEPQSEEMYTFRFSSNQPIEQFDPNGPIEQHSYLYNGSLNRPAFEIISHADIRPTTPVRFEQTRDLSIKVPKVKKYSNEFELIDRNPESTSWYSNRNNSKSPTRRGRSFTQPIKLNYGNQESIYTKGKPVEWQVARELRTTDWDRIKNYTDNTLHSFYEPQQHDPSRYYSINELNDEKRLYKQPEYSVPKKKTINDPIYSSNLHSNSSIGDKSSYLTGYSDDGEQSKTKIYNYDKKNLLDYISSNSSDISSYNKLNLYKNKLIDNSNEIKHNIANKSDLIQNSLYENKWRDDGGRSSNATSTSLSVNENTKKPTILTKIIRDPDTNEILSKTRIDESNFINKKRIDDEEQLEKSNISVIDVTYDNSPVSFLTKKDEPHIPPLPPPLQFQHDSLNQTSIINVNTTRNRLSPILSKRSSSNSNYDKSSSESSTHKHANEDFQPFEVLNVNESFYQTKPDSPVLTIKSSFSEQSKKILEQTIPKSNLFQDIQKFNPSGLRSVKEKQNDSNIYDKIVESSSNRSSSFMSNNTRNKTPSVVQSQTSYNLNDDRNSLASSTHMSKRSSHFY